MNQILKVKGLMKKQVMNMYESQHVQHMDDLD